MGVVIGIGFCGGEDVVGCTADGTLGGVSGIGRGCGAKYAVVGLGGGEATMGGVIGIALGGAKDGVADCEDGADCEACGRACGGACDGACRVSAAAITCEMFSLGSSRAPTKSGL